MESKLLKFETSATGGVFKLGDCLEIIMPIVAQRSMEEDCTYWIVVNKDSDPKPFFFFFFFGGGVGECDFYFVLFLCCYFFCFVSEIQDFWVLFLQTLWSSLCRGWFCCWDLLIRRRRWWFCIGSEEGNTEVLIALHSFRFSRNPLG